MQDVDLTAKDGTKLHSWMMWPRGWSSQKRRSRPTVLFFQARSQATSKCTLMIGYVLVACHVSDCSVAQQ